jgi:AcrR family transcriptional regulator
MPRPPGQADKLLLDAAKRLVARSGFANLKVREVAKMAGVNLGMFHYHFKTRDQFIRVVIEELYGEFFIKLKGSVQDSGDPLKDLREFLIQLGASVAANHVLFISLMRDLMNEEAQVVRLLKRSAPPHVFLMRRLFRRCQRAGVLPVIPFSNYAPLVFGAIAQPLVFHEIVKRKNLKRHEFSDLHVIMSPQAVAQRVDVLLLGMRALL